MANEWVAVELYGPNGDGQKRRVTIADGVSVSVGTLLQMLDPRTASYSHLAKVAIIGVAAEEKIANSGAVDISVFTDGIFEVTVSGAVVLGQSLTSSLQDNKLQGLVAADVTSAALLATILNNSGFNAFNPAYALETGSDAEVINVRLKL